MKRILILSISLLFAGMVGSQTPQALQVKEITLNNGMTVWLNEDHSQPKVFGAVVVKAGSKDCPDTGIAHYFEHIMFKGTDRMGTIDYAAEKPWLDSISAQYDQLSRAKDDAERYKIQKHINALSLKAADYMIPNEFSRLVSLYGGSGLNAATSYDVTYYHNSFLPQYIKQWCILNSERLLHPVFRGFQGELENVYEEKNRTSDLAGDAIEKIFGTIFKNQPYAYPILGSTESLKNPQLSVMEAFYKKYYVASNMGLILCGDIHPDASLTTLLEQTFGRIPRGVVPQRVSSPMPDIDQHQVCKVTFPIPLIGIEALVYKAPTDFDPDANALYLANRLLSNSKAGLLDSLVNEHHLQVAEATSMSLSDAGGTALIIVPNLMGKMKKAESICMQQVQRIIDGDFSAWQLEAQKRDMLMEAQSGMESIESRAEAMIDVFSRGHRWQDLIDRIEAIKNVSKEDVMQAARKYYHANHITFKKKFGIPKKETLSQPGYTPISPKNTDAKSALALELEKIPVEKTDIRLVDFEHDATTYPISDHATLYYKTNPLNDIFNFTLRFKDGIQHTPQLAILDAYLNAIGTDSLSKQQMGQALQRMGVSLNMGAGNRTFVFSLQGPDDQLKPALELLAHFLQSAKGDPKALKDIRSEDKVERKGFGQQKDDVTTAMIQRVAYGKQSSFLRQPTRKDVKALTNDDLIHLLHELQTYDCEIIYTGTQPLQTVAELSEAALPLGQCRKKPVDTFRPLQSYDEPTVFFFHVPKSRQNTVVSYESIQPLPSAEQRATLLLWDNYFGGSMSSVLFQHVREFRSLAYSTSGYSITTNPLTRPNETLAYVTATGTQADKTLEAMSVVDSLLRQLPMKEENLSATKQTVLNDIQNSYPTFRSIPVYIANERLFGYSSNPNATTVGIVPTLSAQDIMAFHRQHIAGNTRVWIVIGDRKQTDFKALARFGKVVELKKEDIYR